MESPNVFETDVETTFSTKTGKALAHLLAAHIVRTEPFEKIDDCVFAFTKEVTLIKDKLAKAPVGEFIMKEIEEHIHDEQRNSRYTILLTDKITHQPGGFVCGN